MLTRELQVLHGPVKCSNTESSCLLGLVFRDRVSLCNPGCPRTHSVDQASLELRNPPASASQVLVLKACATNAWLELHISNLQVRCLTWHFKTPPTHKISNVLKFSLLTSIILSVVTFKPIIFGRFNFREFSYKSKGRSF